MKNAPAESARIEFIRNAAASLGFSAQVVCLRPMPSEPIDFYTMNARNFRQGRVALAITKHLQANA